jgi:hypothetical protein
VVRTGVRGADAEARAAGDRVPGRRRCRRRPVQGPGDDLQPRHLRHEADGGLQDRARGFPAGSPPRGRTPSRREAGRPDGDRAADEGARAENGPGRAPASCRSWIAYARTPAATITRKPPVQPKKTRRSRRTIPRARSHPRTTAARPSSAEKGGRRVAEGLHHRPQQEGRLDAFAGDGHEPMRTIPQRPRRERPVDAALERLLHRAGGLLHPEDHPGHHADGDQRAGRRSAPALRT